MDFNDYTEAIDLLAKHEVETFESNILFPRHVSFNEDVHEAVEYLIDEWDFGIKYI